MFAVHSSERVRPMIRPSVSEICAFPTFCRSASDKARNDFIERLRGFTTCSQFTQHDVRQRPDFDGFAVNVSELDCGDITVIRRRRKAGIVVPSGACGHLYYACFALS